MPHIRVEVDTYAGKTAAFTYDDQLSGDDDAGMARRALDGVYRQACEWLDRLDRKPQEER